MATYPIYNKETGEYDGDRLGYQGVSPEEQALLAQFGNFQGGYGDAAGASQAALQSPGAWSTIQGMLPKLSQFMMGGGQAADDYQKAGMQATRKAGIEGMNMLRGQQGQAGGLGSTIAGLSDASMLSNSLSQANQVRANASGMRESNIQNRMALGMQGLGNIGGMVSDERNQNIMGTQGFAGQQLAADQMKQQQMLTQLGMMGQQRMEPYNAMMDQWGAVSGIPRSPSGVDMFLGGLGEAAKAYGTMGMSGMGGGAGGGGYLGGGNYGYK